jgi:hypothetical protein
VGFSAVVSLGPNTAVDLAQVLDFLANDARTHSILVYMEGIRNARRFMSALRSAANAKPVVVLKAGRKPAGNKAALTHSAPSSAATMCSTPRCAAPARCGCARSCSCSRPPSAWPRATGRWAAAGHRHQRRRPGRAGGRLGQRDRPGAGQLGAESREALRAAVAAAGRRWPT